MAERWKLVEIRAWHVMPASEVDAFVDSTEWVGSVRVLEPSIWAVEKEKERRAQQVAEDMLLERAREESEQPEPVLIDHAL